ncbi:hypothetical protein [Streptomyces sp. JJ38]|uniref:hypothetical protein n=1 Tax=Streptomyces sp. JJ38 TaxID=2738128 RepID=UPI001C595451|nr:hypothetical protein [Streptomyces sp. JJ38]MBW1597920.1 hypothetical protein [Streptomyces sp. JJ38]
MPNDRITLMAAGELRDAMEALRRNDRPAAAHALMSIDPDSWHAIEHRLSTLDGTLGELLAAPSDKEN